MRVAGRIAVAAVVLVVVLVAANWPTYTAVTPAIGIAGGCASGKLQDGGTLTVGSRIAIQVCALDEGGDWTPIPGTLRFENLGGRVAEADAANMSAAVGTVIRGISPGRIRVTATRGELSGAVDLMVVPASTR